MSETTISKDTAIIAKSDSDIQSKISQLETALKVCEEALGFYADRNIYGVKYVNGEETIPKVENDYGKLAREAIAKIKAVKDEKIKGGLNV